MNEFDVSAVKRSGCQVVTLRGDLDGDTAPLLDDALDQLSRREKVIVDLSRLDVLTSAGMQSLLRERRFGRPTLACPDGRISRILEIVQAHRVVPVYRDLDGALQASADSGRRRQRSS